MLYYEGAIPINQDWFWHTRSTSVNIKESSVLVSLCLEGLKKENCRDDQISWEMGSEIFDMGKAICKEI